MIKTYVNNMENDELFVLSNFPGGEPHARIYRQAIFMGDKVDIVLKGSDLNEYAQVLMMVNLLRQYNVEPGVFVPYLAGARADHDATQGWHPYALMAREYPNVTIADPHSRAHIRFFKPNQLKIIDAIDIFPEELLENYDLIIAPDVGARSRANEVARYRTPTAYMKKERDQATGRITKYDFDLMPAVMGRRVLVVDDICDGGMTFALLAKKLREFNLDGLDLYVTHGIFSGNAKENLSAYDNIYTTNSLESASNVDSTIIDIERIYLEDSGTIPD